MIVFNMDLLSVIKFNQYETWDQCVQVSKKYGNTVSTKYAYILNSNTSQSHSRISLNKQVYAGYFNHS